MSRGSCITPRQLTDPLVPPRIALTGAFHAPLCDGRRTHQRLQLSDLFPNWASRDRKTSSVVRYRTGARASAWEVRRLGVDTVVRTSHDVYVRFSPRKNPHMPNNQESAEFTWGAGTDSPFAVDASAGA